MVKKELNTPYLSNFTHLLDILPSSNERLVVHVCVHKRKREQVFD